jgi:glycosyltransferase involved in cell wall biosynthesis
LVAVGDDAGGVGTDERAGTAPAEENRADRLVTLPRVTVVIAAFNAANTISSALKSVLAQTEQRFEVVVVDDGSTDDTATSVASFEDPRVRLVTQRNRGPSAARNTGLRAARGEYISILDADDLWLPQYLEVMTGALEADQNAAFAYTDAWVLEDGTGRIRRRSAMSYQRPPTTVPDPRSFYLLLLERNFVYTSVTARRSVLEAAGGYDETLGTGEDWDLWLRISAAGGQAVRPPGLLAIHRNRRCSLASDGVVMTRNVCEIYRRLAKAAGSDEEVRAVAQRQLVSWESRLHRLQHPTTLMRLRSIGGSARRRALSRRIWLNRPPPLVEQTLRGAG